MRRAYLSPPSPPILGVKVVPPKVGGLGGRLSAEMLNKAVRMQVAVLVSRTSPTDLAVEMAKAWGITLLAPPKLGGRGGGEQMQVYSGEERVTRNQGRSLIP